MAEHTVPKGLPKRKDLSLEKQAELYEAISQLGRDCFPYDADECQKPQGVCHDC